MPRVAPNVPAETDLLCEFCGYTLNGLPPDARCPECGEPVERSVHPDRSPPPWETRGGFWATTAAIIFRPTRFFRKVTTRGNAEAAATFGRRQIAIASAIFGLAALLHAQWLMAFNSDGPLTPLISGLVLIAAAAGIYLFLKYITRIAARLTNWEATYRGFRLSTPVVRRALDYHAAHYLPVACIALLTVIANRIVQYQHVLFSYEHASYYLYTLSAEVILAAGYLFHTYWIGMRNMMYANV